MRVSTLCSVSSSSERVRFGIVEVTVGERMNVDEMFGENKPLEDGRRLQVSTLDRRSRTPLESFSKFLEVPFPLVRTATGPKSPELSRYCREGLDLLSALCLALQDASEQNYLSEKESQTLQTLRGVWLEHLFTNRYSLWIPPPASGGKTAAYSLAVQLWLLAAHANVILDRCGCIPKVSTFVPDESDYLHENNLVVEGGAVSNFSMRAWLLCAENFLINLDRLTWFHYDYSLFLWALEVRLGKFLCFSGRSDLFNVPEWCVEDSEGFRSVSEAFLTRTMIWFAYFYEYYENHMMLSSVVEVPGGPKIPTRVPNSLLKTAPWWPGACYKGVVCALYRFSLDMTDETHTEGLENFLTQLALRPSDLDVYRKKSGTNVVDVSAVSRYQFGYCSHTMHVYRYHLLFKRKPHEYVSEWIQWNMGEQKATRSDSLGIQNLMRNLALLFVWHQLLIKFDVHFRFEFVLFHRDPQFCRSLVTVRTHPRPVIVQQFGYFSVLVPRHSHESGTCPERVYDCEHIVEALCVWMVWFFHMTGGTFRSNTNLYGLTEKFLGPDMKALVSLTDGWIEELNVER